MITSTDAAEADGNNSFSTGTLTQSELENHAQYSASSAGIDMSLSTSQKTNNNTGEVGESEGGFGKSIGRGSDSDSRQSTTQSGINTASIAINDADAQKQLTGQTVEEAIADIKTATSTDTAQEDSNGLQNNFDQAEVEALVNSQRVATQALDQTVTEVSGLILGELDELEANKDQMDAKDYESKKELLSNTRLLVSAIGAGLLAPTDSVAGSWAAAASPVVANQIGQYFKGLAADNDNSQLSGGQEAAHNLAHGILAAAVASAGGNDALTAGVAAAGAEAAAPALAEWLYGSSNPEDLSADEKQTLTAILGAASTAVGATTGNSADAVSAGQLAENAVANNYLSYHEKSQQISLKAKLQACNESGSCTQTQIDQIKNTLGQLNKLDKKRDQDYANACAGGLNVDCGRESGNAYGAYRSYDGHEEVVGSSLVLSHEQDKTRTKAYNAVTNDEASSLGKAVDNAEALGNALVGGVVAVAKTIGYIGKAGTPKVNKAANDGVSSVPEGNVATTLKESGAVNNATQPLLNRQLNAEQIAKGHSFDKHVVQQGQFPFIKTKEQFAAHLESVIKKPTHHKKLGGGREAFYDSKTSTIIIKNPKDPDGGTAFQESLDYFNRQN